MKNETSYLLYIMYVCRHDIDIKFALRNYCSLRMRTLLLPVIPLSLGRQIHFRIQTNNSELAGVAIVFVSTRHIYEDIFLNVLAKGVSCTHLRS